MEPDLIGQEKNYRDYEPWNIENPQWSLTSSVRKSDVVHVQRGMDPFPQWSLTSSVRKSCGCDLCTTEEASYPQWSLTSSVRKSTSAVVTLSCSDSPQWSLTSSVRKRVSVDVPRKQILVPAMEPDLIGQEKDDDLAIAIMRYNSRNGA